MKIKHAKFFYGEWLELKEPSSKNEMREQFSHQKKGYAKISQSMVTRMLAYTSCQQYLLLQHTRLHPSSLRNCCLRQPNHILDNWILTIGLRMRTMPRAVPCQCVCAHCACRYVMWSRCQKLVWAQERLRLNRAWKVSIINYTWLVKTSQTCFLPLHFLLFSSCPLSFYLVSCHVRNIVWARD